MFIVIEMTLLHYQYAEPLPHDLFFLSAFPNQNKNNPTFVLLPPHRSKELKKDPDVDMCIHHTLVWLNGWSMAETDPSHCCCAARVSSKWLDIHCQGSTHREFVEPMSKATTASTNLVIWLSPFPVASAPASRAASQARAILGRKHNMPRFPHMDESAMLIYIGSVRFATLISPDHHWPKYWQVVSPQKYFFKQFHSNRLMTCQDADRRVPSVPDKMCETKQWCHDVVQSQLQ